MEVGLVGARIFCGFFDILNFGVEGDPRAINDAIVIVGCSAVWVHWIAVFWFVFQFDCLY